MSRSITPVAEGAAELSRGFRSRALSVVTMAAMCILLPAAVQAQELPEQDAADEEAKAAVCEIETVADESESTTSRGQSGSVSVIALCAGQGTVLGSADRHRVFTHRQTGAMAVEIVHLGRTRVILLQRDAEGGLVKEDITGTLSLAAGGSPTSGLRGATTDFREFERTGVIALESSVVGGARSDLASTNFSLDEHNHSRQVIETAARAGQGGSAQ